MIAAPADRSGRLGAVDAADLLEDVRRAGLAAGLAAVGVTSAQVLEPARTVLHERKAKGLHATMQFTYRNPDRSTDPRRALPSAASLVVGAHAYHRQAPDTSAPAGAAHEAAPSSGGPGPPSGRVARYAWRDHYADLRAGLDAMAERLRAAGAEARVLADDNALVDRAAAWRAGLGWYGKNANLLLPGAGSWFVLGAVLTDAELPTAAEPVADGCGSCTRCLEACPTGAIVAPGVVDARRCLAWLVQAPGSIPVEFRTAVGDRVYGCDDCQEVCPPTRVAERRHPPPPAEAGSDARIELAWLLDVSDEDLLERLGRWYVPRRDPDHLRRNGLVVLGNTAEPDDPWAASTVERYRRHPNPMLRAHATWAARRLGLLDRPDPAETDPEVRAEWLQPVERRGPAR